MKMSHWRYYFGLRISKKTIDFNTHTNPHTHTHTPLSDVNLDPQGREIVIYLLCYLKHIENKNYDIFEINGSQSPVMVTAMTPSFNCREREIWGGYLIV